MPYKSKKQQRFMNAVHPDIAARWNQYPMPKKRKGGTLPKDVHNAADRAGIPWDNDSNFMNLSQRITGKKHIDKMTSQERDMLINSMKHGGSLPSYQASPQPVSMGSPYDSGYQWDDATSSDVPDEVALAEIESQKQKETDWQNQLIKEQLLKEGKIGPEEVYASGRADYVPLEALALPGTPLIKGASKLANIALDIANPLAGIGGVGPSPIMMMGMRGSTKAPLKVLNKAQQEQMKKVIPMKPAEQVSSMNMLIPNINKKLSQGFGIKKGKFKNWDFEVRPSSGDNLNRLLTYGKPKGKKDWQKMGFMQFDTTPKTEKWMKGFMTGNTADQKAIGRNLVDYLHKTPGFVRTHDYPTELLGANAFGKGVGAEFNKAINQAIKSKRNTLLSSGHHSARGSARYVRETLAGRAEMLPQSPHYSSLLGPLNKYTREQGKNWWRNYREAPEGLRQLLESTMYKNLKMGGPLPSYQASPYPLDESSAYTGMFLPQSLAEEPGYQAKPSVPAEDEEPKTPLISQGDLGITDMEKDVNALATGSAESLYGINDPIFSALTLGLAPASLRIASKAGSKLVRGLGKSLDYVNPLLGFKSAATKSATKSATKPASNPRSINAETLDPETHYYSINKIKADKNLLGPKRSKEVLDEVDKVTKRLSTKDYLKRRMAVTGEPQKQAERAVERLKQDISQTKIALAPDQRPFIAQGHPGSHGTYDFITNDILIDLNRKYPSQATGTIRHELEHASGFGSLDRINPTPSPLPTHMYTGYPKLTMGQYAKNPKHPWWRGSSKRREWDEGRKGAQKHLNYLGKPHEQQVRGVKALHLLEKLGKWKPGQKVTTKHAKELGDIINSGKMEKGYYSDLPTYFRNIESPGLLKASRSSHAYEGRAYKRGDVPSRLEIGSPTWNKEVTRFLGKVFTPSAIGLSYATQNKANNLPSKSHGGNISTTGYQGKGPNSGPFIIPDNNITMEGVPFPVEGTPINALGEQTGKTQTMIPGKNYRFPQGSSVYETPLMKRGGCIGYRCGGPLPMYFGGGDIEWGGVAGGAASGAAAGSAVLPGWGTAIGAVVGGGAAIFNQSKQFEANEQTEAIAEEQKIALEQDKKTYGALNKFVDPVPTQNQAIDYGGSWGGLETPMYGQSQNPSRGYRHRQKGGYLPSYQEESAAIPTEEGGSNGEAQDTDKGDTGEGDTGEGGPNWAGIGTATMYGLGVIGSMSTANQLVNTPEEQKAALTKAGGTSPLTDSWAVMAENAKKSKHPINKFPKFPDYSTPFYKSGGSLPSYQSNDQELATSFYDANKALTGTYGAYEEEQKRVNEVIAESVRLAEKHAREGKDYTRPITGSPLDTSRVADLEAGYDIAGYIKNPDGTYSCYGDTCITAATSLKREAGATDISGRRARSITGNETFAANAPKMGYEKVKYADRQPGDIVQALRNFGRPVPYHALTLGKNDMVYYDPGSYSDKAPFKSAPLAQYVGPRRTRNWGSGEGRITSGDNQANFWRYIGDTKRLDEEATRARELLQSLDLPSSMPITKPWEQPIPSQELKLPESVTLPEPTTSRNRRRLFNFKSGGYLPSYQVMPTPISEEQRIANAGSGVTGMQNVLQTNKEYAEDVDWINTMGSFEREGGGYDPDTRKAEEKENYGYNESRYASPLKSIALALADNPLSPFPKTLTKKAISKIPNVSRTSIKSIPNYIANYLEFDKSNLPFLPQIQEKTEKIAKDSAIEQYREEYLPELRKNFKKKEERKRAGDFLPRSGGKDIRVYQLDQFLRDQGIKEGLGVEERNKYKKDYKGLEKAYKKELDELNALEDRAKLKLMDRGTDFYYRNIRPEGYKGQLPAPQYKAVWEGQPFGKTATERTHSYPYESFQVNDGPIPETLPIETERTFAQDFNQWTEETDQKGAEWFKKNVNTTTTRKLLENIGISKNKAKEITKGLKTLKDIYTTPPVWQEGGYLPEYQGGGGLSRAKDYGSKKKPYPSVSAGNFAGGGRSYPIPTRADAVDALRLAGMHGRSDVRSKVYAKYPGLKKKQEGGNIYNQQNPHKGATFEAETPEVVKHEENKHPIALAHGGTVNNSNNFTRLTGNRHSDPEGGGQFTGAPGGFVYSDFIEPPEEVSNKFKNLV